MKMTLVTFPAGWGEPSQSPFCTKAIYLLNLAGADWSREDVLDPRPFPQGKLPVLRVDGRIIADTDNIRAYLAEIGHDVDAHLGDEARSELVAWQRLSEEHLYHQLMQDRWGSDAVWPHIRSAYFGSMPMPLRQIVPGLLRRRVLAGLTYMGHARQDERSRVGRVDRDLQALVMRLGDTSFLFGDKPSSADASLGAMLGAMQAGPVETALIKRVKGDVALTGYIERVASAMGTDAR